MSQFNNTTSKTRELEKWLQILLKTYQDFPSHNLAKVIYYYIERIICCDEYTLTSQERNDYFVMKRFWLWQSTNQANI